MSAVLLARLIASGTPADLVAEVAMELGRAAAEREALAGRRHADKLRKQKQRSASRDITGQHVTERDRRDASPLDKKAPQTPKEIIPPTPTVEADASTLPPAGGQSAGDDLKLKPKRRKSPKRSASRLAADWQPPAIEDLPLEIQALVRQWPAGAYEVVAILFRNHWLSEGRAIGAKRDWPRTWHNWLIRESAEVMRKAKHGVRFDLAQQGKVVPIGAAASADYFEKQAGFFDRIGRDDDAAEYRRQASKLRAQPP